MIWAEMSAQERLAAVKALARAGMVESEMMAKLSSPDGSIRTLATNNGIVITKVSERKAQARLALDKLPATVWDMDEDDRRRVFAARERRGAHNTLKTLGAAHV